jgi:hypothetical protein
LVSGKVGELEAQAAKPSTVAAISGCAQSNLPTMSKKLGAPNQRPDEGVQLLALCVVNQDFVRSQIHKGHGLFGMGDSIAQA